MVIQIPKQAYSHANDLMDTHNRYLRVATSEDGFEQSKSTDKWKSHLEYSQKIYTSWIQAKCIHNTKDRFIDNPVTHKLRSETEAMLVIARELRNVKMTLMRFHKSFRRSVSMRITSVFMTC